VVCLWYVLCHVCLNLLDEELYGTVSQSWTPSMFFEVVSPDEVAYTYKIKPAVDFGVPLVSYCILLR